MENGKIEVKKHISYSVSVFKKLYPSISPENFLPFLLGLNWTSIYRTKVGIYVLALYEHVKVCFCLFNVKTRNCLYS